MTGMVDLLPAPDMQAHAAQVARLHELRRALAQTDIPRREKHRQSLRGPDEAEQKLKLLQARVNAYREDSS